MAYHLFLDEGAFVESLVGVLHVHEEGAYATGGQAAVCRDTLQCQGSGVDEPELLVKIENVLLQTFEVVPFLLVRGDGVPGAKMM